MPTKSLPQIRADIEAARNAAHDVTRTRPQQSQEVVKLATATADLAEATLELVDLLWERIGQG